MQNSALTLVLLLTSVDAQQQSTPKNPVDSFTGVLRNVSLEGGGHAATLSIESGRGRIPHQIHCTASTRITEGEKPVPLTQLKVGGTIDCTGTLKDDVLEASNCTVSKR
jgi:hypothetical protein